MAKLDPFVPTGADPWDRRKAAHLMRRAGFGALPSELDAMVGDGSAAAFNAAIDALVDYPDADPALDSRLSTFGGVIANPENFLHLAGQWYFRMRFAAHPLREQFSVFWHDHFATQQQKIRDLVGPAVGDDIAQDLKASQIMATQIDLFRTLGINNFRDLLIAETRDPAMLLFLDNWQNIWLPPPNIPAPQENYARELMELFSMGVNEYTEDDVREVARVLTGESLDTAANLGHMYRQDVHDPNPKTIFGQPLDVSPGNLETEALIDLILGQNAPGQFMAEKLLNWFVHPDPPAAAIDELAANLRSNDPPDNYNFREALRILFKSSYFYEPQNYFAIYKTPIDFAMQMIRQLELTEAEFNEDIFWFGVAYLVRDIGMGLFEPPNVGGWIHGEAWINSVSLINRYNLAELASRLISEPKAQTYFPDQPLTPNETIIDDFADRLVQDDLRPEERAAILSHLDFLNVVGGADVSDAVRYLIKIFAAAHLLAATPKAQLK